MMKLFKGFLLVLVLFGLAGWVLGAERVHHALKKAQKTVQEVVDDSIEPDDAGKMKKRLEKLQRNYPKRIAVLQTELAELDQQIGEVEAERQLCQRVVELCERDHARLLAATSDISTEPRVAQLEEVAQVQHSYGQRLERASTELERLKADRQLLAKALDEIQEEKRQLDQELRRLEREIDALKRNEQLIKALKAREGKGASLSDSDLDSLKAVRRSIAQRRATQESQLSRLRADRVRNLYESRALLELAGGE